MTDKDKKKWLAVTARACDDIEKDIALVRHYIGSLAMADFIADKSSGNLPEVSKQNAGRLAIQKVRDAVILRLIHIGESLNMVAKMDGKGDNPSSGEVTRFLEHKIDISAWYGFRSKLAHDRNQISYKMVWDTCTGDDLLLLSNGIARIRSGDNAP